MDGAQLTLHDLIHAPDKAEHVLEDLSADEIAVIEQTIRRVKKRKLEHQADEDYTPAARATRPRTSRSTNASRNEPMIEIRDGVEWVSFVYSHNRILKRYNIRTDIQTVALDMLDEQFKLDNCVYPRANLPKEAYRGNRWNYETECNRLGWKLAWLNKTEIAGKRGLIQRAVDSYRNRSPSMRSRRVARQAKLMSGNLRKRKFPGPETACAGPGANGPPTPSASEDDGDEDEDDEEDHYTAFPTTLAAATVKSAHSPKTLIMVDETLGRFRIKINVEAVVLDSIPKDFREANTVFPRAAAIAAASNDYTNNKEQQLQPEQQRSIEESVCNELGWKLAWLNPRYLANKKTLLQRAMDMYRHKFMPALQPRRHHHHQSQSMPPVIQEQQQQQQQPAVTTGHTTISSPALTVLNTATSIALPPACLSPSLTGSPFEEFQLVNPSDLLVDSTSLIDPCLMLSSPFIPLTIPEPTTSEDDESWFKIDQHDPSISHYMSSYLDFF